MLPIHPSYAPACGTPKSKISTTKTQSLHKPVAAKERSELCLFRGAFGSAFFNMVLALQGASYFVEQRLGDSEVAA
jgi:hypothetical protein